MFTSQTTRLFATSWSNVLLMAKQWYTTVISGTAFRQTPHSLKWKLWSTILIMRCWNAQPATVWAQSGHQYSWITYVSSELSASSCIAHRAKCTCWWNKCVSFLCSTGSEKHTEPNKTLIYFLILMIIIICTAVFGVLIINTCFYSIRKKKQVNTLILAHTQVKLHQ